MKNDDIVNSTVHQSKEIKFPCQYTSKNDMKILKNQSKTAVYSANNWCVLFPDVNWSG